MTTIDDPKLERRAKELAEADGFTWQLVMRRGARFLSPARRQLYLDRAAAEIEDAEDHG